MCVSNSPPPPPPLPSPCTHIYYLSPSLSTQLHFRYIEAYDDEGHAGWVPTLSFEFTNEDGNVEEQTGTLAEVREWCDLGCIPED